MNQNATLAQMRELKLIGMAQAFEAIRLLPIDKTTCFRAITDTAIGSRRALSKKFGKH